MHCGLCCPKIPEEELIQAFYTTVASSVLWGSGCWSPSTRAQQLLSIQENRWLRCTLGGRKDQDVEWVDWFRATKRSAHALMSRLSLPALRHRALAAMHGWAGHVAWKEEAHPGVAAILWRNGEWWEIMKNAGTGAHDQSWRHQKNNSVRGFEHALSKIYGLGWWDAAKRSRESWQRGKYKFVSEAERRWREGPD